MRIISLLPAATEIVCLLGLRDALVGRSHECDHPAEVADVPVMTFAHVDTLGASSAEINARVSERLREGLSLYGLHEAAISAAKPDLILTQALCDVCAVSADAVHDRSGEWGIDGRILSLSPTTLSGVLDAIRDVGAACGVVDRADAVIAALRARLDAVARALNGIAHRPTVAALEWLDPPYAPGHWVPEQIELAGGQPVLGQTGARSECCHWDDLIHVQPEMVVMLPCGFDVDGATSEFVRVSGNEVWRDVPATYLNQLYAVDANAYFSRPGPRLIDGVELLAGLLHPNRVAPPGADRARRVSPLVAVELNAPD
jgi:iron complex transport system substrate-binding protein